MMSQPITLQLVRERLPVRPVDGHKGTFGHVFILAGSRGFTGAAKLAAESAGRSGVGLVTVGSPRPLADAMAVALYEAMSRPLPATPEETLSYDALEPALAFAVDKQAVVLGPGISQHPETRRFVLEFVRQCPTPMIVDADGLNCLSTAADTLAEAKAPILITPHPGEMARLMQCTATEVQADRENIAKRAAQRFACVVALKGHRTVIADPNGNALVNPTGNAGLASGGTGDVLAGLLGGLLAQGISPYDAALIGVYTHGLAADIAVKSTTQRGLIARDVTHALPMAWHFLEREA
ncbi:MAG: NAD(P)H-hydrate dehydratase [Candidatus Hydrogenedentes bacterium]|nr:NAD(P)H-hydrate dehydratase [Candidatus Hydrogenedentota bacterium]